MKDEIKIDGVIYIKKQIKKTNKKPKKKDITEEVEFKLKMATSPSDVAYVKIVHEGKEIGNLKFFNKGNVFSFYYKEKYKVEKHFDYHFKIFKLK